MKTLFWLLISKLRQPKILFSKIFIFRDLFPLFGFLTRKFFFKFLHIIWVTRFNAHHGDSEFTICTCYSFGLLLLLYLIRCHPSISIRFEIINSRMMLRYSMHIIIWHLVSLWICHKSCLTFRVFHVLNSGF